jgi:hypothetical protein
MSTQFMSFKKNWLNKFSFSYEFLKSKSWNPKKSLMSRMQMIIIFIFCYLMTSLNHPFVHILNKQEKYLMCR